ncbi:leucine--tRNA ligase [Candidatus Pacearchaeota archaeon]|nr:leucine--tRNA ligase [Candidatus Pacearchaeota archaeon]MCK5150032.1 leucine--tRNA ligase [Candidatus Pacearchaeota archaeon]
MDKINFNKIEKKWQKKWKDSKIFEVKEDRKKEKFYVLEMFPYPSASGLHMGHALNYTLGDILARFKRMQGFNVLYPMGYDALGLPAENAAIKEGTHPEKYTKNSMKNFMNQQSLLGLSYDWSRLINTSDSGYYQWDQWIFLKMLEKGIAYRKKSSVNWCPECKTVLANEQVQNGKCWRHPDTEIEVKPLEQWFLKITDYAEELLDKLEGLDWPQRTKAMQKNWIGKSYGTEILFEINEEKWPIFTTRPDTIYGVTFMVVSAQHQRLMELVTKEQKKEVEKFLQKLKSVSAKNAVDLEKEGVFTGSYAINPLTNEKVPVYAGNFVVADYGSGMVMAVPAHDQRDFDFAKKYKIEIKKVIVPKGMTSAEASGKITNDGAYTGLGKLINSEKFNGLENEKAKEEITKYLEHRSVYPKVRNTGAKKLGRKVVQFKLRDWLISRQRYWGTPIPIVYCEKCGIVPIPEKDLPIKLPKNVEFGKGNPLETNEKWIKIKCPKCDGDARRETDTMDTFVNSSWYFLRYCDPNNKKKIFDMQKVKDWMPIDQYIGGAEHACMHLIYCRFYTKFLRDLGLLNFDEPIKKLFHQGMLHGDDGEKMSKSKGNILNPLDTIANYSTDSLRLALMSFASPDSDSNWDEKVLIGSHKFLKKIADYFENVKIKNINNIKFESKLNKIIKEVTSQIGNFKYNLAIIKLRDLFNSLPNEVSQKVLEKSLKLLHVFCPHITEELWEKIDNKNFISLSKWPEVDESKIDERFEKQEQFVEKLVGDIQHVIKLLDKKIKNVFVYVLPNEKNIYVENLDLISKRIGTKLKIYAVNDKEKYDPENKSKKVKPGRPGIYLK